MLPDDHWLPSDVDVCATLSLLNQLIVVPVEIVSGFVPNAVVACVDAPLAMVTVVLPAGAVVGVPEGLEGELYPPHAVRMVVTRMTTTERRDMIGQFLLQRVSTAKMLPTLRSEFPNHHAEKRQHPFELCW